MSTVLPDSSAADGCLGLEGWYAVGHPNEFRTWHFSWTDDTEIVSIFVALLFIADMCFHE